MMQQSGESKSARRKARRYGAHADALGGFGERAAWAELAHGSGVVRISGFGEVRAADGSAYARRMAFQRAGVPWRCGCVVEVG